MLLSPEHKGSRVVANYPVLEVSDKAEQLASLPACKSQIFPQLTAKMNLLELNRFLSLPQASTDTMALVIKLEEA